MAIIPFNPFLPSQWPSFWDDENSIMPQITNSLDLYETENEVVVRANVAGMDPEDIDITFEKNVLIIKAEKHKEEKKQDKNTKHYAKADWTYSYRVSIPNVIDPTVEPEAEIDKGILTIRFKKSDISKPKKLTVKKKSK